jgi:transcriptional regulator with XRE-family HTH domain
MPLSISRSNEHRLGSFRFVRRVREILPRPHRVVEEVSQQAGTSRAMSRNEERKPVVSGNKIRQLGLGTDMRELRLRSGMSTRAVAGRLGVSRMAVHRTESGKRTVPAEEVIALCALYGVTGRDRERLVERATRGDNDASWLATGAAFSDQFRSFVALEKQACRFTHVSMLIVPGLLQTPDYVRALVESTHRDTGQVLETRLARQQQLTEPDAPNFRFLIDESALRRRMGGREVMKAQLAHLIQLSAYPNISVRIIPAAVGPHAGIGGSFIMLDLPQGPAHVYVESVEMGVILSQHGEIEPFIDAVNELGESVLSEGRSVALIEEIRKELLHERTGVA